MEKIGIYEFMAEPFHCDFSGRLFMGHLGNHMLNAADFHSTARGFGMQYLMSIQRSWVLSRLAIEMEEMPRQYTKFDVETWVESAMRYFTSRHGEPSADGYPLNRQRGHQQLDRQGQGVSDRQGWPREDGQ